MMPMVSQSFSTSDMMCVEKNDRFVPVAAFTDELDDRASGS